MTVFWCDTMLVDGAPMRSVRIVTADDGTVVSRQAGVPAAPSDQLLGTVFSGPGNAHSHAFHRVLRGRTHAEGGDFWRWREAMYAVAALLDPDLYYDLAIAVFAEMLVNGYTAVGEFHYMHHRPDGSPYPQGHAMERALAAAADTVGIRLRLFDTAYLRGGAGRPLSGSQIRFGDRDALDWLSRFDSLRSALGEDRVAAAFHSVRAVPRRAMVQILAELGPCVPLHVHLSEQPEENAECLAEYGVTPTGLLGELGALTPRLSVIHATHLSPEDIGMLGAAAVTVVMCPTTEADLGDGIGPATALTAAGAVIALGSDQNAIVDPFVEVRSLEYGERLSSGARGRFSPRQLVSALTTGGYRSLGLPAPAVGSFCDLVEVNAASSRTVGSTADQLVFSATGADVIRVIVGGRVVAENGLLISGADPAQLLHDVLRRVDTSIALSHQKALR